MFREAWRKVFDGFVTITGGPGGRTTIVSRWTLSGLPFGVTYRYKTSTLGAGFGRIYVQHGFDDLDADNSLSTRVNFDLNAAATKIASLRWQIPATFSDNFFVVMPPRVSLAIQAFPFSLLNTTISVWTSCLGLDPD